MAKTVKAVFDSQSRVDYVQSFEGKKKKIAKRKAEVAKKELADKRKEKLKKRRDKLSQVIREIVDHEGQSVNPIVETHNVDDQTEIICERLSSSDLPGMPSERLLVPGNFTVGNLITSIRNRIKVSANTSLFLFVNNSLLPASQTIASVFQQKHDEDGFLYIVYSGENSFGQIPL